MDPTAPFHHQDLGLTLLCRRKGKLGLPSCDSSIPTQAWGLQVERVDESPSAGVPEKGACSPRLAEASCGGEGRAAGPSPAPRGRAVMLLPAWDAAGTGCQHGESVARGPPARSGLGSVLLLKSW